MKKESISLIIFVSILTIFGLLMIYSSSYIWSEFKFNDSFHYAKLQLIFLIISYISMYIVGKINYKVYYKYANIILFVCMLLLVLVLIPGIGQIRNGSRSWFAIGPIGMQPSEFCKIGLVIFVAKYLSKNNRDINNIKKGLLPIIIVIGLFFLLIMLEPDFGSAVVIVMSLFLLIFISGANISFFITLLMVGLFGLSGLIIIAPYRLKRIISFINPWSDPLGSGYQIIQSLYAIGPGGLFGLGFKNSIQKQFYLPEPQTDFIFSIISEEFGFIGVLIITSLFLFIFITIIRISFKQKSLFAKYLSFGLGVGIIVQAMLNLSVVVGLIPVTGVTLPFLSYGGSSLLISMISIGIIINISNSNDI